MNQSHALRKNDCYKTEVLSVSGDGFGICKIDGMVVFVPQVAAGDICDVKIVKVLSRYAYGIATKFYCLSAERIKSVCPVYRQCGGCSFCHLTYTAELKIKEAAVRDAFKRIGGISLSPEPILPSLHETEYRNKAQYPIGSNNGKMIYGFYANRSHRIIPSRNCLLQPPIFSELAEFIANELRKYDVLPYDEKSGKGDLRHLYLRTGEISGEIMVCFVVAHNISKKITPFITELIQSFPQIKSIVLNINPRRDNVILGERCITLWGKDTIEDILCGLRFKLSPLSFYQVNRSQAERLYEIAKEYAALKGSETVIDLYCGVGTIGLSMANDCKRLIGIEIIESAVEDARKNAERNGINNAEFLCADAKSATKTIKERGIQPDVVLLDPPRKGCDASVITDVAQMNPSKIVMISCNPSTAARDCSLFETQGYFVRRYRPVDMFPRTKHVETVVLLSREIVGDKGVEYTYADYESEGDEHFKRIKDSVIYKEIKE